MKLVIKEIGKEKAIYENTPAGKESEGKLKNAEEKPPK